MRLLNINTKKLVDFTPEYAPPYAILSHRWEEGEVLFEHFQTNTAHKQRGWEKLKGSCEMVKEWNTKSEILEYIWIDTCCIDKSSSAELSESINSMFTWYQRARVCFAYLSDVPDCQSSAFQEHARRNIHLSLWFTRGWTLQELLAPREMQFFSHGWIYLGSKNDLSSVLSRITRIPEAVLTHSASLDDFGIAERMSWASRRTTTRAEDLAYCLLGLFDINMPMLYGEGGVKAFIRLQEEIVKVSSDTSIFAWTDRKARPNDRSTQYGLLATSVRQFAHSHGVIRSDVETRPPYSMTNKGLGIALRIGSGSEKHMEDILIASINCQQVFNDGKPLELGIYIKEIGDKRHEKQFVRVGVDSLRPQHLDKVMSKPQKLQAIYVKQRFSRY